MILGFNFIAERDVTKSISNLSLLLGAALIVVVVFFLFSFLVRIKYVGSIKIQ